METRIPQFFHSSQSNALMQMGKKKGECQIFADGTQQDEGLIQTIEVIFVLGNHYNWKEGKEKLYYQNFGRALKGQPSKK